MVHLYWQKIISGGVFPSVALAWRMNEENFLKNVEQLSNLKLRLSYGISGNSAVSAYQTQGGLGKTMYAYLINNTENRSLWLLSSFDTEL